MRVNLTVSIVQMQVRQFNAAANLAKGEFYIREAAKSGSTVIVFPEMWTTGFNFKKNISLAAEQEKTIGAVSTFAKQYYIWLSGSILTHNPSGMPRNTAILFLPEGVIVARYSKIHLFSLILENHIETAGDCLTMIDMPWGKSGFAICYDLRFPELFRSPTLQREGVIFSAAVPYSRLDHWEILIRARAIENQLFMIAANQNSGSSLKLPCNKYTVTSDLPPCSLL